MAPTVQQRSELQNRRSVLRRAYTALKEVLAAWQQVVLDGRTALECFANNTLKAIYFQHYNLGPLAATLGLQDAANRKYQALIYQSLEKVVESVDAMRQYCQEMAAAVEAVADSGKLAVSTKHLATFKCLTQSAAAMLLETIVEMHQDQLKVCNNIMEALDSTASRVVKSMRSSESQARKHNTHGKPTIHSSAGSKLEVLNAAHGQENCFQAMLATWMLQTKIEDSQVQSTLELIREDMKGE